MKKNRLLILRKNNKYSYLLYVEIYIIRIKFRGQRKF
jgi:hypothetical protein